MDRTPSLSRFRLPRLELRLDQGRREAGQGGPDWREEITPILVNGLSRVGETGSVSPTLVGPLNQKIKMSATELEAAISNSISLSSIFILIALGLAITFGVMRVINMAHGDMLMLGAYTAYLVTDEKYLGLNL